MRRGRSAGVDRRSGDQVLLRHAPRQARRRLVAEFRLGGLFGGPPGGVVLVVPADGGRSAGVSVSLSASQSVNHAERAAANINRSPSASSAGSWWPRRVRRRRGGCGRRRCRCCGRWRVRPGPRRGGERAARSGTRRCIPAQLVGVAALSAGSGTGAGSTRRRPAGSAGRSPVCHGGGTRPSRWRGSSTGRSARDRSLRGISVRDRSDRGSRSGTAPSGESPCGTAPSATAPSGRLDGLGGARALRTRRLSGLRARPLRAESSDRDSSERDNSERDGTAASAASAASARERSERRPSDRPVVAASSARLPRRPRLGSAVVSASAVDRSERLSGSRSVRLRSARLRSDRLSSERLSSSACSERPAGSVAGRRPKSPVGSRSCSSAGGLGRSLQARQAAQIRRERRGLDRER